MSLLRLHASKVNTKKLRTENEIISKGDGGKIVLAEKTEFANFILGLKGQITG